MKDDLLLGKETHYKFEYDKSLIFPIGRDENRKKLNLPKKMVDHNLPFYGVDVWTGYEVSWLNEKGKPVVAIARFTIPVFSTNIVESKSFKLYLNSFNQTPFSNTAEVQQRLQRDLSEGFGADIQVELFAVLMFPLNQQNLGTNIDELDINANEYTPNGSLLSVSDNIVKETLHSHLLKSNCPVTSQPDWATLVVEYEGSEINQGALLKYVISYRGHDDFHEHCVEQIFCDLCAAGDFTQLTVSARYTRRGGLDINPTRSLGPIKTSNLIGRLARQ